MSDLRGLIEPLSERQLEILAYLAEGLSNREIASRLYLSLAGVKWNNSEIYGKLGVSNRDEAVARAHELGLLDGDTDTLQHTGKHNLLQSVTHFVGRKQEIQDILQLLTDENKRFITILAPGGMGKTRLSLAIAHEKIGKYADGVYFVPLAPLSSPNDIVTTLAENIGFVFHGEQPPTVQLVHFLKDRDMLLVLDNFEHLLDGASLVSDIMQSAPEINIIVTSRERLNLRGENVYSLRGLEFPTWETPEDALEYDAVKLFMQSATRTRSDFELHPDDLDFLARICRLTAGMPLGIELAAGWVDVLSMEKIADEIQHGIDILETDMRDVPERHRSLRASFEQTWHRLTEDEQTVFARLSVFRGGFTLESAEAVAGANVRHLRKLAQKALIHPENDRYAVHELLRQFGEDKLAETKELPSMQTKHAQYFTDFMLQRKQDFKTSRQLEALELIDPDFDNIRVAWLDIVDQHQWEQLPKFLHSLWYYCDMRSRSQDLIQLFEYGLQVLQATNHTSETHLAHGRIMAWLGWFYNDMGFRQKGIHTCHEALDILHQHDSQEDLMFAYYSLAMLSNFDQNYDNSQKMFYIFRELALELGDHYWYALSLSFMAFFKIQRGDNDVVPILKQATSLFENLGTALELEIISIIEIWSLIRTENLSEARDRALRAVHLITKSRSAFHIADRMLLIGVIETLLDNYQQANLYLFQALRVLWEAGYTHFTPAPLLFIAQLMSKTKRLKKAVEIRSKLSEYPTMYNNLAGLYDIYEPLLLELQERLDPTSFAVAWERGQQLELNDLIRELLAELEDE